MWHIALDHWWEFVVRSLIVYAFLLILLRCTGKRQVGQLAPFDLVLLLVLANAVQNAMVGPDSSIPGAMLAAGTLVGINYLIGWMTFRSKKIEALVEGRPVMIIHNGHIDRDALAKVQMTTHELEAALRCQGHVGPENVRFAVLENNGELTVVSKKG